MRTVTKQIAVAVALSFFAYAGYAGELSKEPKQFETCELSTVSGDDVTIPSKGDKATVLIFLSCDCPIANAFAPEMNRIFKEYEKQDVAFYRVYPDTSQSEEKIKTHTKEYSHLFPAIRDDEQILVQRSGARITPEAVVIDAEGKITYRGRINDLFADIGKRRRQATTADLRDAIKATIKGKEVKVAETRAFGCYIPLEFEEKEEDAS